MTFMAGLPLHWAASLVAAKIAAAAAEETALVMRLPVTLSRIVMLLRDKMRAPLVAQMSTALRWACADACARMCMMCVLCARVPVWGATSQCSE